jgi:hypothetical protein
VTLGGGATNGPGGPDGAAKNGPSGVGSGQGAAPPATDDELDLLGTVRSHVPGPDLNNAEVLAQVRHLHAVGWTPQTLAVVLDAQPLPREVRSPTRLALARLRALPDDPDEHPAVRLWRRAMDNGRGPCEGCGWDDAGEPRPNSRPVVWTGKVTYPDDPGPIGLGLCAVCFPRREQLLEPVESATWRHRVTGEEVVE